MSNLSNIESFSRIRRQYEIDSTIANIYFYGNSFPQEKTNWMEYFSVKTCMANLLNNLKMVSQLDYYAVGFEFLPTWYDKFVLELNNLWEGNIIINEISSQESRFYVYNTGTGLSSSRSTNIFFAEDTKEVDCFSKAFSIKLNKEYKNKIYAYYIVSIILRLFSLSNKHLPPLYKLKKNKNTIDLLIEVNNSLDSSSKKYCIYSDNLYIELLKKVGNPRIFNKAFIKLENTYGCLIEQIWDIRGKQSSFFSILEQVEE